MRFTGTDEAAGGAGAAAAEGGGGAGLAVEGGGEGLGTGLADAALKAWSAASGGPGSCAPSNQYPSNA